MLDALMPSRAELRLRAHPRPTIAYRAEIDGLRAVAVVAVVLFHSRLGSFNGGFVGVDIFFVISGFLITQFIAADAEQGRFSFARFYERRVRRLFPALFVTVCASLVAAAFLFLPSDFRNLGRNVAGVVLFVANIFYFKQTDYFDSPAEVKPLLHTWSLGVEEQFYIFFPLLLIWLLTKRREAGIAGVGMLALLSLAAGIFVLPISRAAAFYLTPFRIWEFMAGSLLALGAVPPMTNPRHRILASTLGLAAILASCLTYSPMIPFPGVAALLPVLGAALVIHAETGGRSFVGRLLASRPAVFTGKISYSLYLWHWPIIVFADYYVIHELSTLQSILLVAASFGVAALSWRFIELPFRKPRNANPNRLLFAGAAAGIACAAVTGMGIYSAQGMPGRFSPEVDALSSYALSMNPKSDRCGDVDLQLEPLSPCTIGDATNATQFLWGDSHAGALFGALDDMSKTGPGTIYGATPRCPPLIGVGSDEDCIVGNDRKLDYVLSHPEIRSVILAARWSLYVNGRATKLGPAETNGSVPVLRTRDGHVLKQFSLAARGEFSRGLGTLLARLLASGRKVVLVYPIPETGYDVPSTLARLRDRGEDPASFTTPRNAYERRQRFVIGMLDSFGDRPNLVRIYPQSVLCRGPRCLTSMDGKPLYFDSHHLSIAGARLLEPELRASLAGQ